jgi:hypothetical protein
MASSGILRRVALVRTDVSEELSASFITVTRIGEMSILKRATRRNIPEDAILHRHRREKLKSSTTLTRILVATHASSADSSCSAVKHGFREFS